ncbi:MAG: DeoR/GlpR transcriptional regulator [Anaerolineales bacterium]|nr:MAG: DeoR/GlpR transcriptional regulator [Anaerolineales bacterium]
MLSEERRNQILEIINHDKIIKIKDITKRFNVSIATVRRDLDILQEQLYIKRVYGGAIPVTPSGTEPLYFTREMENRAEKIAIGKAAAEMVVEGDTIYLDIGTTTQEVGRNLKKMNNITVITSSLTIMTELANSNVTVYSLGGKIRPHELSMSGSIAIHSLEQFCVQKAFIGAAGVTFDEGISDFNYEEAQVRLTAIKRAKQAILVVDSTKFGNNAFARTCSLDYFHTIVTDINVPKKYIDGINDRKINLVTVQPAGGIETS